MLRADVERDRAAAAAAVRTAAAQAAHDYKLAGEQLERLQHQTDANKKALVSDISGVAVKLDSVEAFMQTRAKASDLQALEPRVSESERNIERLGYDLKTKAASTTLNSVSDRLTCLTMDVQANASRSQADKESLVAQIGNVEKAIAKTDRQIEFDREKNSSCLVALEKELQTKALKVETDLIGPKTLSASVERLESRALGLERIIKLNKDEMPPIVARVEALEAAYPTRADAAEIPKLSLALAETAAKHDTLHTRTLEHDIKLEKFDNHVNQHLNKLESIESRAVALERQISTKADTGDHFRKDHTMDLFRDYYRREEIDAMLSRVWWRVGDMSKGKLAGGSLTTRP